MRNVFWGQTDEAYNPFINYTKREQGVLPADWFPQNVFFTFFLTVNQIRGSKVFGYVYFRYLKCISGGVNPLPDAKVLFTVTWLMHGNSVGSETPYSFAPFREHIHTHPKSV